MVLKDGKEVKLGSYTINDNNYFKLRDIAHAFNIGITYDTETKTIGIDTTIGYLVEETPTDNTNKNEISDEQLGNEEELLNYKKRLATKLGEQAIIEKINKAIEDATKQDFKEKQKGLLSKGNEENLPTKEMPVTILVLKDGMDLSEVSNYKETDTLRIRKDNTYTGNTGIPTLKGLSKLVSFTSYGLNTLTKISELNIPKSLVFLNVENSPLTELNGLKAVNALHHLNIKNSILRELTSESIAPDLRRLSIDQIDSSIPFKLADSAIESIKKLNLLMEVELLGVEWDKSLVDMLGYHELTKYRIYSNNLATLEDMQELLDSSRIRNLGLGGQNLTEIPTNDQLVGVNELELFYSPNLDISNLAFRGNLIINREVAGLSKANVKKVTVNNASSEIIKEIAKSKTIEEVIFERPYVVDLRELEDNQQLKLIKIKYGTVDMKLLPKEIDIELINYNGSMDVIRNNKRVKVVNN